MVYARVHCLFLWFSPLSSKCVLKHICLSVLSWRAMIPLPGPLSHSQPPRFCFAPALWDDLAVVLFQEGISFCRRLKPRAFIAGRKQKNAFLGINFNFGQLISRSCSTGDVDEKLSCKYGPLKRLCTVPASSWCCVFACCRELCCENCCWKRRERNICLQFRGEWSVQRRITDPRCTCSFTAASIWAKLLQNIKQGLQQLHCLHLVLLRGCSSIPFTMFPAVLHIQYIYSYANVPPHCSPLFWFFLMRAPVSFAYCVTETTLAWASSKWLGRIWSQQVIYWHQPGQLFPHVTCKGFCRISFVLHTPKNASYQNTFLFMRFLLPARPPTPCQLLCDHSAWDWSLVVLGCVFYWGC